jgi:flagellar motor switch protein FliM
MPPEMARRQLTQDEIDAVFKLGLTSGSGSADTKTSRYDFLRPNRIPASELRAIRLLHENFARSLASSLSAYLRSYVTVNLVSFEQIPFQEFVEGLPSPTIVAGLSLHPFDGSGVLELGPASFFPILEMLLGGDGQDPQQLTREITDIEQRLVEMLLRVIVNDLREAWKTVAAIDFAVQCIEKEPQFLQLLASSEAVIAIGMEICAGNSIGPLNIAIPSLAIKMMHEKFDQPWITRRSTPSGDDQQRMFRLLEPAEVDVQVALDGSTICMRDLMCVQEGDLLILDLPVEKPVSCLVNGRAQFHGHVAQLGSKCAFVVDEIADTR